MAYFEEYKSLEEKLDFFNGEAGILCGDIHLLFDKLERLQESGNYLFRGMSNAKYKLYNSAQREYLKRELLAIDNNRYNSNEEKYNKWIEELISGLKAWNSNSVENYFASLGINNNEDIAYLSFMQHYGFSTPLLDFTTNPFTALFFAIDNVNYNVSNFNLDSCVSLYYFNKRTTFHEVLNVDDNPETSRNRNVKTYDEFIKNNGIAIIEHNSSLFKVRNSMNIINQEGCFIFNWHAINPLEVSYPQFVEQLNNTESVQRRGFEVQGEKMTCLNIHKSIIPRLKYELDRKKGINSSFIYPNLNADKELLIEKSISNLLD